MSWFTQIFCCCGAPRKEDEEDIDQNTIILSDKTEAQKKRLNKLTRKDLLIFGYGMHPKSITRIPEEIIKFKVSKIVFGDSHMVILYEDNKKLIGLRGSNFFNQLGLPAELKHNKQKTDSENSVFEENKTFEAENSMQTNRFYDELINHQHKLNNSYDYEYIDAACESNRTLLLVKFKNKEYNELYVVGEKNIILDQTEEKNLDENHVMQMNLQFAKLKIKKIFAKKNTSLFLTEDNSIYVRGAAFFNYDDEKFQPICKRFEKQIHSIDLGNEHIILLTTTNDLYVYGNNTYGELGNPEFKNLFTLSELKFFKQKGLKVLKIAAGARHNLVLCSDLKVYAFGDNSQFQCSGANSLYSAPYKISKENQTHIIDIYAGYNYSVLVSKNNLIWSFGDNSNYKCGTDLPLKGSSVPIFSSDMLGLNIGKIFVGINNTAIVLSDYENCIGNRNGVYNN